MKSRHLHYPSFLFAVILILRVMYTVGWSVTRLSSSKFSRASFTRRNVGVVYDFLANGDGDRSMTQTTTKSKSFSNQPRRKKHKVPRSERKALEREKKARTRISKKKNNNYGNKFQLHSTAVSQLTSDSTAEDV